MFELYFTNWSDVNVELCPRTMIDLDFVGQALTSGSSHIRSHSSGIRFDVNFGMRTQCGKMRKSLPQKNCFSSNKFTVKFFSKKVNLTEYL